MTYYYSFTKEHKIKLEVAKNIDKEISYKTMKQFKLNTVGRIQRCNQNIQRITSLSWSLAKTFLVSCVTFTFDLIRTIPQ